MILRSLWLFLFIISNQYLGQHKPFVHFHSSQTPITQFKQAPCMFELPAFGLEGIEVECGYLTVPEDYDHPEDAQIQIAVVIIKAINPNAKPDPIFLAQGGPGASTIDTYAQLLLSNNRQVIDRDIVLFDQRGTLFSKPSLTCDELDQLILDTIEKDIPPGEYEQLELDAISKCRARLIQEGVNLSEYNSLENAADIESLRVALNYSTINLYGVSYGTLLAMHYMQLFPGGLRSVILDGVLPQKSNFILDLTNNFDRSLDLLFDSCRNDIECNNIYPDLESTFYRVVQKLDETPAMVKMTDQETGISYDAIVDGEFFVDGIFLMMYVSEIIPALPWIIHDADRGNFEFFSKIMPLFIFDRTTAYGMYFSVLCAEYAHMQLQEQDLSDVHPLIVEYENHSPAAFIAACKTWNVPPLEEPIDQPSFSDIPVLILSGGFDPITPPKYGLIVSESLKKSYEFTVGTGGHGQAFNNECIDKIIEDFLKDPSSKPDSTCIKLNNQMVFYTPNNIIELGVVLGLLNLDNGTVREFLIIILCLFGLCSSVFVYPLTWLIRKLQLRLFNGEISDLRPSFIVRIARWLAIFNSFSLTIFLISLSVVVIRMLLENDNRLFFGIDSTARPIFVLPYLAFCLTITMLYSVFLAWRKRHWSIWERSYYTFLFLCASGCVAVLILWDVFSPLIV